MGWIRNGRSRSMKHGPLSACSSFQWNLGSQAKDDACIFTQKPHNNFVGWNNVVSHSSKCDKDSICLIFPWDKPSIPGIDQVNIQSAPFTIHTFPLMCVTILYAVFLVHSHQRQHKCSMMYLYFNPLTIKENVMDQTPLKIQGIQRAIQLICTYKGISLIVRMHWFFSHTYDDNDCQLTDSDMTWLCASKHVSISPPHSPSMLFSNTLRVKQDERPFAS